LMLPFERKKTPEEREKTRSNAGIATT